MIPECLVAVADDGGYCYLAGVSWAAGEAAQSELVVLRIAVVKVGHARLDS